MKSKHRRVKGCLLTFVIIILLCLAAGVVAYKVLGNKNEKKSNQSPVVKKAEIPYQEAPKASDEFQMRYYYQQLNENQQLIYREIVQGLKDDVAEIYLHTGEGEDALGIYTNVLNDFPEFFWCTGEAEVTFMNDPDEGVGYAKLKPIHPYGKEEREKRQQEIEAAASTCLAGISVNASTYEKIKYIYDYIIKTTDYNLDAPDNQNIYSVLINRQSVCAGYARANQYLLSKLGVHCVYVTGTATSPTGETQPHGWNIVQCEEEYYHVDVTWGDPIFTQDAAAISEEINYDYFLCSDSDIIRSHAIDPGLYVPQCNAIDYNYYIKNGMYYEYFDVQQTLSTMKNSINSQSASVTFKYMNDAVYQEALSAMVNDLISQAAQHLSDRYGIPNVTYYYQTNEQVYRITVSWVYG